VRTKRGQVTIFIIIAIVLVAGVGLFFLLRDKINFMRIPSNIEPAYNAFLVCLEEEAEVGVDILETQGGYIELPDFETGSSYMPFSSQLNFVGTFIPYWYYVSGNGVEKEKIPSKNDMEEQLQTFIEEKIRECDLDVYYEDGFEIEMGKPTANVKIANKKVTVDLDMQMTLQKGEDSAIVKGHEISVDSELGNLYDSAKKIYEKEQEELFLEEYAIDFLRVYAPVDGVKITCSPLVWSANEIFDVLEEAIEINTLALRTDDTFLGEGDDYFVVDVGIDEEVRFINSKNWPKTFEVSPSEDDVLLVEPVGTQQGLGVLGFCYVPYHFVYDIKYPVLVQVSSGEETFQFPLAVIIQGNQPRESLNASAEGAEVELCEHKNTPISVTVYDDSLNSVDAEISYRCFGETCMIGTTSEGQLTSNFPQCVNGYVIAQADGFDDSERLFSVVQGGSVQILMNKLYELDVNLNLDGIDYSKEAIIYFISPGGTKTVVYPRQNTVELAEGQYEIQVYIFQESSIELEATTYEQCVETASGVLGIFGATEEKCFDVEIPAQTISNVLVGGGKQNYYLVSSELQSANTIDINAESLDIPKTLSELQNNYILFEDKGLDISLK